MKTLIIKSRLASKITIPSVPLSFRSIENSAWERNHPLEACKLLNISDALKSY
jgi:hypothetical protein